MKFSVDTDYRVPTVVRHQGVVIVLALDGNRDIYYRVLALDPAQPDDDKSWSHSKRLSFPDQIRPAGMSLVTAKQETAERTADAPFQAVSDGKHVYLFRQSTDGTLYVDRFVFDLASQTLNPAWEARFQRSRKRDVPASRKDSLGARDMEGEPFFEPTTELMLVNGLQDGRFCVLLLPGRLPSEWRWQIFATNSDGEIDSFSIGRGEDGLFDMADVQQSRLKWADTGQQFQTGPAALLYMQQEEAQDEYGRPQRVKRAARVMLAAPVGSSRYALELDGVNDHVSLGNPDSLKISGDVTIEAWVKPQTREGLQNIVALGTGGVHLRIEDKQYQIGVGDRGASYDIPQEDTGTWVHLAGAYDSERGRWRLFRNGTRVARKTDPKGAVTDPEDWGIGESLAGQINNVRLWNVARAEREVKRDMHRSLAGDEPGLVGCWPMDEGAGDTVLDRVSGNHDQLHVGHFSFLELDGMDDYVSIPNADAISFGKDEDFTVAAWIKPAPQQEYTIHGDNDVIEKWSGSGGYPYVIRYLNRTAGAREGTIWAARYDGENNPAVRSKTRINDGAFHHVAFAKQGPQLALYIDGVLEATAEDTTTGDTRGTSPLFIGARGGWGNFFSGQIHSVRIWDGALSVEKIQEDMGKPANEVKGVVGNWGFDQRSGDTIHDRALGHHGQLHVGVVPGYALAFDGVDDHVHIEDFEWPAGGPVTVEFWAKVNAADVRRSSAFTVGAENDPNRFHVHLPWHDYWLYWDYGDCGGAGRVKVDYRPHLDRWTHVALVSKGSEGGMMGIYLNGELVQSTASSDGPNVHLKGLWIGKWDIAGAHKGQLADFRIWGRVRSKGEIKADMHKRLEGDEDGLAGYWRLDEGSGDTIRDRMSGHHDGQLYVGPGDSADTKWVAGPIPVPAENPDDKWREGGAEDPKDKWVPVPPLAILDFGVSREGTLALIGDEDAPSEVTLVPSGSDDAAQLSVPVIDADGSEVAGSMRTVRVDKRALTVSAGLLSFARSGDTPYLLDGADGLIHLYFRGDYGQFLVAQHDTLTARAAYTLPLSSAGAADGGARLQFTARRPGSEMQGYKISIAGRSRDICRVTIDSLDGIEETWRKVPRDLESFLAVLNGTATGDPDDPLGQKGELVYYNYGENVQRKGVPDLASGANPYFGSTLFAVEPENLPDTGVPISVRNAGSSKTTIQPGRDSAWVPEPQAKALKFHKVDDHVALPHDKLAVTGDLVVEAWVRPDRPEEGGESDTPLRLINFRSGDARFAMGLAKEGADFKAFAASEDKAVQTADAQVSPGEWTHLAAVYNATNALNLDGEGYVDCGNDVTLDMTGAMTVEAWVTPAQVPPTTVAPDGAVRVRPEVILSKWGATEEEQSWRLYIDSDGKACFEARDRQRELIRVKANALLTEKQPSHLAAVFEASPKTETALTFDGEKDYVSLENPELLRFAGEITIEAWIRAEDVTGLRSIVAHGPGGSQEVFLRVQDGCYEIGSHSGQDHKTSYPVPPEDKDTWVHLAGVYNGEQGAWILYRNGIEVSRAPESTGAVQVNAVWAIGARGAGTGNFEGQINNVRIWDRALSVEEIRDGMDKPPLEIEGALGHWDFDQADSRAGEVYDHSGNKNVGRLKGNLSSASFVDVDKCRYEQRILVNGHLGGWRYVTADDDRTLGLVGGPPGSRGLSASDTSMRLCLGPEGHVDVGDCLLLQDEQVLVRQVSPVDPTRAQGVTHRLVVERAVNGLAREHRIATVVRFLKRAANEVALTTTKVNIGCSASDEGHFLGMIDDVRLWDVGRRDWQVRYYRDESLPGNAEGLVGDWRFEEGRGKTATDSKGSNHGRLVHPEADQIEQMWTAAARNATLTLYVDGRPVETSGDVLGPADFGGYGPVDQFTIGAMIGKDGAPQQQMSGCIDEVRVWNEVRSPEQIRDNMYRALSGAEEILAGHWPLDEGGGTTVHDQTGNGQDGSVKERQWVASTAPIGNEGPEVRHVLGGLVKPGFLKQIAGPPAAVEYGDMQWEDEGNLFGVMKRCYAFRDGAIQLVTGFKVGDLELNFVGQVQTAPTLIGYIEGAPPVPSENLTFKDPSSEDYVGASAIELTEAKETTQVYSSSRDTGFDMSVDLKAGLHWETGIFAGLGVEQKVFASEGKIGLHAYFEHSMSHLSAASRTAGTSKTLTKSLTLAGGWEEERKYDGIEQPRYLNPEVGRRYLPNNMGYALVKSGTADLFALRLKRLGSLVAFQLLPNPDIPEDWNIIMFPLNPKYVKNGTLDGMVGLVADPDYPGAIVGERGSYFKPLEAYALKEQIERETKQIEGYYDSFTKKARPWTGESGPESELPEGELGYDWETGRDKRSMANTYVWTADGGFYAEQEQFSSIRQESLGSAYHFLGQGGLYADVKLASPVGFFFELDAMFGGHINTTISKSEEEKAAFGLHVDVQGEGSLNRWEDPDRQQGQPAAEPCPGKVDAYRFMTFYLAPKPQNFDRFFEEIVDPEWLSGQGKYAGEYGSNARALREARNKPNQVWRVMHRVTYVSRIPPEFERTPVEAVPKDVRLPTNIVANIGLIQEIERIRSLMPHSKEESHLVILGRAADRLLVRGSGDGQGELADTIPWWAGVPIEIKKEIRRDVMAYLKGYYEEEKEGEGEPARPGWQLNVKYQSSVVEIIAGTFPYAGIELTVTDPWGNATTVMSGSKVEHGPGGFEVLAGYPDTYTLTFLDQRFEVEKKKGVTFVTLTERGVSGS